MDRNSTVAHALAAESVADPPSPGEMVAPVTSEDRSNTDSLASGRRVDLEAVTNVDPNMRDAWLVCIGKEHEVARLRVADGYSRIELIDRNSR